MVVLGIVVAVSLVVAIVGSVSISDNGTTSTVPSQSDPNQLIRAATANPNDSDTVGNLADYYDKTGQYQQALVLYQRYLLLRPDDAKAHVSVGELLLGTGDIQGAQSQFAQAIALKPTTMTAARAHLGLGNVYFSLQPPRSGDALREYQQAADLDPSGDVGNEARQRLAVVQQQSTQPSVTVIAPTLPASGAPTTPAARPTGTP